MANTAPPIDTAEKVLENQERAKETGIHIIQAGTVTLGMEGLHLADFEKYHQAIYRLEIQRKLYSCGAMDSETYRDLIPRLDSIRTQHHNAMLSEIRLLNRLAEHHGLPPFYEGEVSEAAPVRTWVADAVLDYVRQVINDRVTGGR